MQPYLIKIYLIKLFQLSYSYSIQARRWAFSLVRTGEKYWHERYILDYLNNMVDIYSNVTNCKHY